MKTDRKAGGAAKKTTGTAVDSIDLSILAYLCGNNFNNFYTSCTPLQVAREQQIELSIGAVQKRFVRLAKLRLIEKGIKQSKKNGFFLSKKGAEYIDSINSKITDNNTGNP